ncbi:T9SS type A sorting domain-containing protein [uncultured Dokdonia sp.]|uniref:T9SS type A sorting domain-containing protein n=1 Tax=uncultured Dokdonia sp. TaxID=575653 RepID=UPI0026032C29|nr:T9SS type A sorting domain-containing protein [uncultured Dokdonia sp.]
MKKLLLILLLITNTISYSQVDLLNNRLSDISFSTGSIDSMFEMDIDEDGDLDVVFGSFTSGKIGWYDNLDGQGTFSNLKIIYSETIYNNPERISSLVPADIDNDGDKDLIVAAFDTDTIFWLENLNNGAFSPKQVIMSNLSSPITMFIEDIDGDTLLDIVLAYDYDELAWLKNINGQGNFAVPNDIDLSMINIDSVYAADLDSDGDNDIIANTSSTDNYVKIVWFENTDNLGTFGNRQEVYTFLPEPNYSIVSEVHAADIDNDSDQDIIFAINNELKWLENTDGQGDFTTDHPIYFIGNRERFNHLDIKDVDNDGDLDIASVASEHQALDDVRIHENNGVGAFGVDLVDDFTYGPINIQIADINNDGLQDLITGSSFIRWYSRNNDESFSAQKEISKYWSRPSYPSIKDIDNDEDLDIICVINERIVSYDNTNGLGDMGLQKVIGRVYGEAELKTADINGDSYEDLYVIHGNSTLEWYSNDTQGSFDGPIFIDNTGYHSPTAGDIDGDGDLDIVYYKNNNNTASFGYYINTNGQGNFSAPVNISLLVNSRGVNELILSDIDGDTDLDIIYAINDGSGYGKIAWFENTDGLGNFGSQNIITSDPSNKVITADIDSDGDLDIVSFSSEDELVEWYENTDGQANFSSGQIIDNTSFSFRPREMTLEDIDHDGDLDVIIASRNNATLFWYEHLNGIGDFDSNPNVMSTDIDGTNFVTTGDLNGDDISDIVTTADEDNHAISWYKNNGLLTNRIRGTVLYDQDNNGCDTNDFVVQNARVKTTNGTEIIETFTYQNGFYQLFPEQEGEYTTEVISLSPYFSTNPSQYVDTFSGVNNTLEADFCIQATDVINDVSITILPTRNARPGFIVTYVATFHNEGTTVLDGSIDIDFNDTKLEFINSSEETASQTNGVLTFNYLDFQPFETRSIELIFQVLPPPIVEIDEVLEFTATIYPINGDETEENNIFSLQQTVIGSYDPNDITVIEGDQILIDQTDDYLHYIIRFQNTGTASAINVTIENILHQNLDWNTLSLEAISHPYTVQIRNENEVSFTFENINLPDSTSNEPESHGFISYKIKPKPAIEIGEIMTNYADIFFDFNPAIRTNTVSTEVVDEILGVTENTAFTFQVYPIPTTDVLYIESNQQISSIRIYNVIGSNVSKSNSTNTIDISHLKSGMYFLEASTAQGKSTIKKIIKK